MREVFPMSANPFVQGYLPTGKAWKASPSGRATNSHAVSYAMLSGSKSRIIRTRDEAKQLARNYLFEWYEAMRAQEDPPDAIKEAQPPKRQRR